MTKAAITRRTGGEQARQPPVCRACSHFCNDAAALEREIRGLTSFSSAYASVRDQDGLCQKHGRYLSANRTCSSFSPLFNDLPE